MNPRHLQAFRQIMITGSVTKAAERLNVSQPAISQMIRNLEQYCDFKLFERGGGKLIPTREAEALYGEVDLAFKGLSRVAQSISGIREKNWGTIRFGVFPASVRTITPQIIMEFHALHPQSKFYVSSMRSLSLVEAIASRQLDVAICSIPGERSEVESTFIHSGSAVCIVPSDHRLAGRATIDICDLEGERFISLGVGDKSKQIIDGVFEQAGVSREIVFTCEQADIALSLVAMGAGVAIMGPIPAFNNMANAAIRIIPFTPYTEFRLWMLTPKGTRRSDMVDCFAEFCIEAMKTKLDQLNRMFDKGSRADRRAVP